MLARFQALPPIARGMSPMVATTICFTAMHNMARMMGEALPPFEVAFFRNLFGLLALVPVFLCHGGWILLIVAASVARGLTITLAPALFVWEWPEPAHYPWLAAIGIFGTLGHIAFAQAVKLADSTAVLPLDFLRLIWASPAGFFLFAEAPDALAWLGGAVIFGSATYIAIRESRLVRTASTDTR